MDNQNLVQKTTATSGMQQAKEQAKEKPEVKKRHQSSTEWCMQKADYLETRTSV